MGWLDDITNAMDMNLGKLLRDREAGHAAVRGVAKSPTLLDDWRTTSEILISMNHVSEGQEAQGKQTSRTHTIFWIVDSFSLLELPVAVANECRGESVFFQPRSVKMLKPRKAGHLDVVKKGIRCWITVCLLFSSVIQSCPTLCDPMNHSTPGLPVHHQLLEFTQTHVHRVGDAIQPSHPLSSPSPAPNPSQHQSVFQWVNSSREVAKVLEFQL